jgi:hypothetical protein
MTCCREKHISAIFAWHEYNISTKNDTYDCRSMDKSP